MLFCLFIAFSGFRTATFQNFLRFPAELFASSGLFLAGSVLPAGPDLGGRIKTKQENDQDEDDCADAHGFRSPEKNH